MKVPAAHLPATRVILVLLQTQHSILLLIGLEAKIAKYSLIQSQIFLAIFDEKIEIRERCKGVHCVDLGESFPTSIYLQKSASIQPRTSSFNFD